MQIDKIRMKKYVGQCNTVSQRQFAACLEDIFKKLEWRAKGNRVRDEHLCDLKIADDITLFSDPANELHLINDLKLR